MSSRKFLSEFLTFCIISLLSCPLLFAQTETCTFSGSGIEDVEVGQIGNRQIYTLFTAHLVDESDEIFAIIESYRSLLDAIVPLNQLIEWYEPIIASEQSDAQKITELVVSGKIDWIGIEHPRTDTTYINDANDSYLEARKRINMELNQSQEWDASKTDKLLSLVFEPYVISRANHLDIFRRVRIYPLEGIDLMVEESRLIGSFNHWDDRIIEDNRITEAQRLEVIFFIRETMEPTPRLITESEFEILLDRLEIPEGARLNMKILMRIHNNIMSLYSRRDRAVVQSVLDLPGSGLLLFGTSHSYGIKQGLITACQNRNGSP